MARSKPISGSLDRRVDRQKKATLDLKRVFAAGWLLVFGGYFIDMLDSIQLLNMHEYLDPPLFCVLWTIVGLFLVNLLGAFGAGRRTD